MFSPLKFVFNLREESFLNDFTLLLQVPAWKKIWKPKWVETQVPVVKDIQVPAWKQYWVPEW